MTTAHSDIGPPVSSIDVIVRGQKLTAAVDFHPGTNNLSFRLLRGDVPETQFTKPEARALLKAFQEILNSTTSYGSAKNIY